MKRKVTIIIAASAILLSIVVIIISLMHFGIIPRYRSVRKASFILGDYGTAENLGGKTICVSLFVETPKTTWEGEDELKRDRLETLGTATKGIIKFVESYGKSPEFVYNWEILPDLCYEVDNIGCEMNYVLRDTIEGNLLWEFVDTKIPSQELLDKYNADNIVYLAFFNFEGTSFSWDCYFSVNYQYDMTFLSISNNSGCETTATTIAHEILHCFGAPDLYGYQGGGGLTYGIEWDFVYYIKEIYPDDIMRTTFDLETVTPYYGEVHGIMSPITAYYCGLIDEPPQEIYDFNLDLSERGQESAKAAESG